MRQLAAILFADMTGYTALMQENEQLARQKRRRLKAVLESTIAEHNGKILQNYGDGSLSMFNSAIDSVRSAVAIQLLLKEEPKVELRIGIHTGDIIVEEEAIYGDGVNLLPVSNRCLYRVVFLFLKKFLMKSRTSKTSAPERWDTSN